MLTIGKLAEHAGTSTDTIRFYERLGLLSYSKTTTSGYRLYNEETARRVRFIRDAQKCGFSLKEIGELFAAAADGQNDRVHRMVTEKNAQITEQIRTLQAMSAALLAFVAPRRASWIAPEEPAAALIDAFVDQVDSGSSAPVRSISAG